jgi:hypothetical protein
MADEETFDIYGDDEPLSPSSPSHQSGPKKRLRRERSSSAPPLSVSSPNGADSPRGKKFKEEDLRDEKTQSAELKLEEEDEDPFQEYDNHVFTLVMLCVLGGGVCMERLIYSLMRVVLRMLFPLGQMSWIRGRRVRCLRRRLFMSVSYTG